jgi:rfaE bifunctional protein nucleotidyltransferase chain/domain
MPDQAQTPLADRSLDKCLTEGALIEWCEDARHSGLTIGFTCGAFDILHAGHVAYLAKGKTLCDRLVVAVNTDRSIQSYKSPLRPYVSETNRMRVVAALACVDVVVPLDDPRPIRLIEKIKPDYYIKGGDYEPSGLKSGAFVESYGGKVVVLSSGINISTSEIVRAIRMREMYASPLPGKRPDRDKLVLLDRDGTLIENVPYLHEPGRVRLLPGVGEGLKHLQEAGFNLAIVTNQQGIGLGYYSTRDFIEVNTTLFQALEPYGVDIARTYHCPHSRGDGCECRKPGRALLDQALADFQAAREHTYFIGDTRADMEAAREVGIAAVLVESGQACAADFRASDFLEAAQWIIESANRVQTQRANSALRARGPEHEFRSIMHEPQTEKNR